MATLDFIGDDGWEYGPIIFGPTALADELRRDAEPFRPVFARLLQRQAKERVSPEVLDFGGHAALVLPSGTRTAWYPLDDRSGLVVRWRHFDGWPPVPEKLRFSPWAVPEAAWQPLGTIDLDASYGLFDAVAGMMVDEGHQMYATWRAHDFVQVRGRAARRLPAALPPGRYLVEHVAKFEAVRDKLELCRLRPEGHLPARPAKVPAQPEKPAPLVLDRGIKATARKLKFGETEGGPHIAVPEAELAHWSGIFDERGEAVYEKQPTDYARACKVGEPAGVISVGKGQALVLPRPEATAFLPTETGGVFLIWMGADQAADLLQALAAAKRWKRQRARLAVEGPLVLFDSALDGRDLAKRKRLPVPLARGAYLIESGEVEADIADGKSTRGVLAAFVRLTRTTR